MRFHAANMEVVIRLWRLLVRIGPGEADAGGAAADACRLEHRDVCPGLSQPKGDPSAHRPSPYHDHLRHGRLLNFDSDYGCLLAADLERILAPSNAFGICSHRAANRSRRETADGHPSTCVSRNSLRNFPSGS